MQCSRNKGLNGDKATHVPPSATLSDPIPVVPGTENACEVEPLSLLLSAGAAPASTSQLVDPSSDN